MSINTQKIRLLIADDHAIIREGLKLIIEAHPDMHIVGEARNGDEVLSQIKTNIIDVLLLDISMPGLEFLSIMQYLKEAYPGIKILVLSVHPEEHYAVRVLRAGARGYIEKSHSMEELLKAIRLISKGHTYITPRLAEKLLLKVNPDTAQPVHDKLSDREFQIFLLISAGNTVKDIASLLSLNPKTVSTYRARILEKMGFKNNSELIRYSIENGFIQTAITTR
jgi:Response regulator containing a CheY-like receiver domain and an HTH DNA-binding domain